MVEAAPYGCALLGGFAIGTRVALLCQHNTNPSYKLASIPRYDDTVRTVTDGVLKIARRIWEVGVAGSPVIGRRWGAFSTLLRRPGLQASSDGVLATKSERKMLASTCLYSLYAWFLNILCTALNAGKRRSISQPINIRLLRHDKTQAHKKQVVKVI